MAKKTVHINESVINEAIRRAVMAVKRSVISEAFYGGESIFKDPGARKAFWEFLNSTEGQKLSPAARKSIENIISSYGGVTETKSNTKRHISEGVNDENYTHYAVSKINGKIINAWDYTGYDGSELRQFKKDYFLQDLIDNDIDPKQVKILTKKALIRQGINPDDDSNWANTVDESHRHRNVNEDIEWAKLAKVMYPQMKHRPDHDDVITAITSGQLQVIKSEGPDDDGWISVYVQTSNGAWGEWVDVKINSDGDCEQIDWNDIYMDDIKNNSDVASAVFNAAEEYAYNMVRQ